MAHSVLIAGVTGLVGSKVLDLALADPSIVRVVALTRRPTGIEHLKLKEWVSGDLLSALRAEPVDAVLCCLGTTIRKVGGDRSKFIHVDRDLVVGLARWAEQQNVPVFSVVSAIGADAGSSVFYNRVKGEMEEALKTLDLGTLHIFQPSILTGHRKELRVGERIGIVMARLLSPLFPARFKPMPHDLLAQAMIRSVDKTPAGTHTYEKIRSMVKA